MVSLWTGSTGSPLAININGSRINWVNFLENMSFSAVKKK